MEAHPSIAFAVYVEDLLTFVPFGIVAPMLHPYTVLTRIWPLAFSMLAASAGVASGSAYCAREIAADELGGMQIVTQEYAHNKMTDGGAVKEVSAILDGTSAIAKISGTSFQVVEADGRATALANLHSGYDYRGWYGLRGLPDGWLYAHGVQFDSLVRIVRQEDGPWKLTDNIRIRKRDDSVFEAVMRWLLGMDASQVSRDQLTGIVAKSGYRIYSPALRTILFIDEGERLANGKFARFDAGSMRWYYGDLQHPNAALLKDHAGIVRAYDGASAYVVKGPPVKGGWVNMPVPTGRTFIGSGSKAYELRGDRIDQLTLVELLPADGNPVGWFYSVVTEDGTLLLVGRHAVYEIDGDTLKSVWKPDQPAVIYGPHNANRFADGQLVVTTTQANDEKRTFLLSACRE